MIFDERRERAARGAATGIEVLTTEGDPARTALLVHGAGGDPWQFRRHFVPYLKSLGLRVVALGRRHHGRSARTGSARLAQHVANVLRVIHDVGRYARRGAPADERPRRGAGSVHGHRGAASASSRAAGTPPATGRTAQRGTLSVAPEREGSPSPDRPPQRRLQTPLQATGSSADSRQPTLSGTRSRAPATGAGLPSRASHPSDRPNRRPSRLEAPAP